KTYIMEEGKKLMKMGFTVEDIDIRGKKKDELRQILMDKDVIYVAGGNSYYLLKQIKESGFDALVAERVNNGAIYIGVSAGSYVACPTIEQHNWKHLGSDQFGLVDLTAMNLVPFLIFAHFEEKMRELVEKNVVSTKYPVVALYDTQAVLVENGKWKIVGEGKREFYNGFKETLI
ncbi:MAG: Type 1 glutamine amidotransferase-like domain-containing protein, partial [Candidatus Roizmanbacteria bacterium]|nr:Type 1 glutamine amidotransferase-like domain-containing protein [Candidatus Roizmanbacteria bacterium]